jgi:hypothetical protein
MKLFFNDRSDSCWGFVQHLLLGSESMTIFSMHRHLPEANGLTAADISAYMEINLLRLRQAVDYLNGFVRGDHNRRRQLKGLFIVVSMGLVINSSFRRILHGPGRETCSLFTISDCANSMNIVLAQHWEYPQDDHASFSAWFASKPPYSSK